MKRIIIGTTLLGMAFSAGLWAHHGAAGIISDELWNQIDENISDQHNEMLDDMDTTMTVVTDPGGSPSTLSTMESQDGDGGNNVFLETARTYAFDESVDPNGYDDLVEDVIELYVLPQAEELGRFSSTAVVDTQGDIDSRLLYVTYELVDLDLVKDGTVDGAIIYTYEPIGKGNSQVAPDESSEPPQNGNRSGG